MPTEPKPLNNGAAMIITALQVEYKAVLAYLCDVEEILHPKGTIYDRGKFICSDGTFWTVALAQIGAGNAGAALETVRAIELFDPSILLFIGIAGGVKDVSLCDVVAATKVYGYESGKSASTFLPRPSVGESSYALVQRSRAEARKEDWLKRLDRTLYETPPRAHVAPIAAGESVVSSKRSEISKLIKSNYSDAVAVEMEGRGFLQAAQASQPIDALIVRGISDLIARKSQTDASGYQHRAAKAASAFAFEVLSKWKGNKEIGRYVLVLSATIDEVDKNRADAIVAHLREISKDAKLTLISVKKGSVCLILEGTREGYERIFFQSRELSNVLGIEVAELRWIITPSSEENDLQQFESTPLSISETKDFAIGTLPKQIDYSELEGYLLGDYIIGNLIAVGSEFAVYTARKRNAYDRTYALKIFGLTGSYSKGLNIGLQEAQNLASIHHPSVLQFFPPGSEEINFQGADRSVIYWAMDYAALGSCESNPPFANKPMSTSDIESIINLLDGLQTIHDNKLIHGDIKPANILIFQEDERKIVLRITDVGIIKTLSDFNRFFGEAGSAAMRFVAPEKVDNNHSDLNDIYSMGATLFYIVTGKSPITISGTAEDSILTWQQAHKTQPRPNAMDYSPYCPPQLALLIMRMMSVDPTQRPGLKECKAVLKKTIEKSKQELLADFQIPKKLKAELSEFPIRYVPEDFTGVFKPEVHEICGTEYFIIRIGVNFVSISHYRRLIENIVRHVSDSFCLYETWGGTDIYVLLWSKRDEMDSLVKRLRQAFFDSSIEILQATKIHDFLHRDLHIPERTSPTLALAVQENIDLPALDPGEYIYTNFNDNPSEQIIYAFTHLELKEINDSGLFRQAIKRNVKDALSDLANLRDESVIKQLSMIELSPDDRTVLVINAAVSSFDYIAKIITLINDRIGSAISVSISTYVGTGRVIIESDKIVF